MKIISSLALIIISFSILGNSQEGNDLLNRKLFGLTEKEQVKVQDLYMSVEEDLTHLVCEGIVTTEIYYSNGYETSMEDTGLFRISLDDRYLFFKNSYENNWWLLSEFQNGEWINKFPEKSILSIDNASIYRNYGFLNKPLGRLDLNKILNLGLNTKVHLESLTGDLSINRSNGKYTGKGLISYSFPKGDYPDFQNEMSSSGECNFLSEKKF